MSNNSGAVKFPQNQWSLISNEVLYFERNDTSALKRLFRCYTLAVNAKHQWPLRFRCWSPCTLCLVSPPSALIHNRSSSACCFGDFSSLDDGRRPRAIVAWLWTAELYTIKGINYNQPCNGAFCIVWERAYLQKNHWRKREERRFFKKHFFVQKTHLRVSPDPPHMCMRLHLGCLNRWKTQTRLGRQWIEMWSCLLIVLTALNMFQTNKHFIIVTNLK